MDATPSVHLLRALQNQNLNWTKAMAELVDNAFDANANRVALLMSQKVLTVEDDGDGMKNIGNSLCLGRHIPSESTALGMFGVGLKDAWLWAGDRIEVESVRGGVRSRMVADVAEMIANNSWEIGDPVSVPSDVRHKTGTTITLHLKKGRHQPSQAAMDNLAWTFTPALLQGRQITYRTGARKAKALAAVQLPQFIKSVSESFEVSGKKVSIDIGIVADGQKMVKGPYWIQYKHRNIQGEQNIGSAPGFSNSRMGGIIRLGEGFSLTKNKDDFQDHYDELNDAIHSRIKFLLQEAEKLSVDVESKALTTELETRINDAIGQLKREKRDQTRESIGSVVPQFTGKKRRHAAKVRDIPGSVDTDNGRRRHGLTIDFYDLGNESIGKFDPLAQRIILNDSHPYIEHCRRSSVEALNAIAIAIVANHVCHNEGNQLTLFEVQDFSQAFGLIMKPMAAAVEVRNVKRG